jgi:enoyl-CoA hydratase
MGDLVRCEISGSAATITLDDGKVNALSLEMQAEINAALDQAEAANAAAVIVGREGRFSGGFDLRVFSSGDAAAGMKMLRGGFLLAERLLSFPTPVVIGCTGHAIAMGAFLLLSADYRIGAAGQFKIQANETAIGMTLPTAAVEITRHRLAPAHYQRALILAEEYAPDEIAIEAGWLDGVAPAADVVAVAQAKGAELAALNLGAMKANKLRVREPLLKALRAAIEAEMPMS